MNIKWDYVASGLGYMGMHYKEFVESKEVLDYFSILINQIATENHSVSFLYNAFTEKNHAASSKKYPGIESIYADSGGLQIVTTGATITDSLKDEIYRNQGLNADYGFCFDVIPLQIIGESSKRGDFSTRNFRPDMIEDCAEATANNIKRQIEVYDEIGSSCKPILIIQGNCYDSFSKWTDTIIKTLSKYDLSRISSVAISSAATGGGMLETIKQAFYYTQLRKEGILPKHLHLLGVGSLYRLTPYFIFSHNGLIDGDLISYDSTTHTSSIAMGQPYIIHEGRYKNITLGRELGPRYEIMYENIKNNFPQYPYDLNTFYKMLNTKFSLHKDNVGPLAITWITYVFNQIYSLIRSIDIAETNKQYVLDQSRKNKDYMALSALFDVKSVDDFNYWENEVGYLVESKPIQNTKTINITELFS